ncbi:MAG: 50S ribosomal protein L11 methyltransferase [Dongiaceae bacterium]
MWAIRLTLSAARARRDLPAVEAALAPTSSAFSMFETAGGKAWLVEALCEVRPDKAAVQAALTAIGAPPATFAYVAPRDWVAASQKLMTPIRAGRFFVHGAHYRGRQPRGAVALQIEASLAFGTGRHETTRGCLLALDRLARAGRKFRNPLDLGCGSGILALAIAARFGVPVLAADNDPRAVAIARENAIINGSADRVRAIKSEGFAAPAIKRAGPYDLIVANILSGPLVRLARGFARHLAPGGIAIMSGLLTEQEAEVTAAQARHGLVSVHRQRLGDWSVLEFTTPRKAKRRPRSRSRR